LPRHYLRDTQRVEMAIPATMLLALVNQSRFGVGSADGVEDPSADDAPAQETAERLKRLCKSAMEAPFADLPKRKKDALLDRAARAVLGATAQLDDQHALKIGMTLYYFLEELAQRDILYVTEGSEIHQAVTELIDCMGHGFRADAMDASAQTQAIQVLRAFQQAGYFQEAPARAAAE
jgi:hypothetical protein